MPPLQPARCRRSNAGVSRLPSFRSIVVVCLFHLAAFTAFAGSQVTAKTAALSTVSPVATQVGLNVLKAGGNAIDAAVAVAFALAVVYPEAGNLGGGGFLVYYDAQSKGVWTLDFLEVAPLAATRDMYVKDPSGIRYGPLSCAVPGTVAGLDAMRKRFGSRPWAELLAPAIALARDGVTISPEVSSDLVAADGERKIASMAPIFFPKGQPLPPGTKLVQPDLAATLERLAVKGAADFYEGETASKLVAASKLVNGKLGFRDLREYKPQWRAPVRIRWRGYDLYTMAPPSAGGIVIGETLNILSAYDLRPNELNSPRAIHLIAEATRRAMLDRNKYLGDPDTSRIPYRDLLSEERAKAWRASIDPKRATASASLSEPGSVREGMHTTHFTIADAHGNVVSMTVSLNDNFGSGWLVPGLGFFMNDEMEEFTTLPGKPNHWLLTQGNQNEIQPGKRMVTSMSPTIVLKDGKPLLALGTRGGPTIPTTILEVFLNVVAFRKSLFDAIDAPRIHQQTTPEEIFYEQGRFPRPLLDTLNAMGHGVLALDSIGDVHAILFERGKMTAVADPRHGGAAGGY
jgi:gamma-glutamyltranspeptidase/glutathione hydrolase